MSRNRIDHTPTVTLDDVRDAKPSTVYYGVNTCWWTTDPAHLYRHPTVGLPCDPRGGMLMQSDDVDGFIRAAEAKPEAYGIHGLRAFEAAYHGNVSVFRDGFPTPRPYPTCFRTWDEYNEILTAAPAAQQEGE